MADWLCAEGVFPAVIAGDLVVVLRGDGAEPLARSITELKARGTVSVTDVVDVLLAQGVSGAPDFAVCHVSGDTARIVLKGAFIVAVETEGPGSGQFDGRDKRTFTELSLSSVRAIAVWPAEGERQSLTRRFEPGAFTVSQVACVVSKTVAPSVVQAGEGAARTLNYETMNEAIQAADMSVVSAVPHVTPSYDSLFGATTASDLEQAAVREEPAEDTEGVPIEFDESSSAVSAALCSQGHPNPLERSQCWLCGNPLAGASVARVVRPGLGTMVVSDGRVVPLGATVFVGRNPRADRTDSAHIPTLVSVESPNHDISRTHVRVGLEGWQVLLEDMGSTNGTLFHEASGESHRLRPGQPMIVTDGSVAELGDGVTLTFKGIP